MLQKGGVSLLGGGGQFFRGVRTQKDTKMNHNPFSQTLYKPAKYRTEC